jgi:hypothetical protein
MEKKLKSINSIYHKNSVLSKLSERAQHLSELNYLLQQTLPPQFSAHCRLANVRNKTIVIHTDKPSFATLIRFQAPALCKTLSAGFNQAFDKIEIKVKPHYLPLQSTEKNNLKISESVATTLEQTAESIDDGPLKTALEKLAKRRRSS